MRTGPPQVPGVEAGEVAAGGEDLSKHALVREVLALDAFARCWVQEDRLMGVLAPLMEGSKIATFQHIKKACHQRNIDDFPG